MVANRSLQLFREFKSRVVQGRSGVLIRRSEGWLKIQRFEKKNASNLKYELKRSVVDRGKRL